jgi:hypothetical protein
MFATLGFAGGVELAGHMLEQGRVGCFGHETGSAEGGKPTINTAA